MPKTIQSAIAKRVLDVETQVADEIDMTALKSEYQTLFWSLHDVVESKDHDDLVKMDSLADKVMYLAIRKAYLVGLRDGMQIGDGSL